MRRSFSLLHFFFKSQAFIMLGVFPGPVLHRETSKSLVAINWKERAEFLVFSSRDHL